MNHAGAIAAGKEECRTLVLETQELAKNLTKPELKRMADCFAEHQQACVSTSGSPISMFLGESWVKSFVDFFYGDAVPHMTERGKKGNGTVHVPMGDHGGAWGPGAHGCPWIPMGLMAPMGPMSPLGP